MKKCTCGTILRNGKNAVTPNHRLNDLSYLSDIILMPKRKVLILDREENPWRTFLEEFFTDIAVDLWMSEDGHKFGSEIARLSPDLLFINEKYLSPVLIQKIKAYRETHSHTRFFGIFPEKPAANPLLNYDAVFREPITFQEFQKLLAELLPLPESIRVLTIDDEEEIGFMIRDFLQERKTPLFQVEYQENGRKGLEAIRKNKPDVIVLDVKMPVMDGIETYRKMKESGWNIPVIIFFDAIFGDEVIEIHKIGRPVIIEKGTRESQMPYVMTLILKLVYFG